ncbi:MAG: rhomboid family intramembrane serine protease [Planctomycetes bacterium]|nr:rhomboid family intramembrane serine protease [Planctomycetota bacterium]
MAAPTVSTACPHCSARVRAPRELVGRAARCPKCGKSFVVAAPPEPKPAPEPSQAPSGELRLLDEAAEEAKRARLARPTGTFPCPACHAPLPEGAVLCVKCGTSVQSGRRLLTKARVRVGDEAEEIRSWVSGVSLILPLAIVPYRTTIPQKRSTLANTILVVATCLISFYALIILVGKTERGQEAFLRRYGLCPGDDFAAHQLVTHLFLHAGLAHLVGNMVFLWVFGAAVSSVLGWQWYPALYLILGALAGYIGHVALGSYEFDLPLIGASGAICGLTGLYLVLFPRHDIHMAAWFRLFWWTEVHIKTFPMTGIYAVLFFTAFDVAALALGWAGAVAHGVHIAGFLSGFLLGIAFLLTGFVKSEGYDLLTWLVGDRWRFARDRM